MKKKESLNRVRAADIAAAIEEFAPLSTQVDWDNSGFTVGDPDAMVSKALIALNCTLNVIAEAVEKGCDMIITHHPLIVHAPCLNILSNNLRGRSIELAVRNNITIYSSHTPLDRAAGGLNDIMAKMIGLRGCRRVVEGGFCTIGSLAKQMSANEILSHLKEVFGAPAIRCSKPIEGGIKKVAVSSGSGQGSIKEAIGAGAQLLVTGDVTHHNFYTPKGFMIADIGHHYSELPAIALLNDIVKKNFPTFATLLSEADKSPIFNF